jgi:hypothetical protein
LSDDRSCWVVARLMQSCDDDIITSGSAKGIDVVIGKAAVIGVRAPRLASPMLESAPHHEPNPVASKVR